MKYSVVPKEIVSHYGSDFRSHPGTGPLKLWEENVNWSYENPLFYEKTRKFYLEAITFYRISKVVLQFIQGKLDFTSGLDPIKMIF
jgi:peptide/nickel transport system substrate-binding protein